jgi:hypothetical protein
MRGFPQTTCQDKSFDPCGGVCESAAAAAGGVNVSSTKVKVVVV